MPDSSDPSPYVAFRIRDKEGGSGYRLRRPRRNNDQSLGDIREIRQELEVRERETDVKCVFVWVCMSERGRDGKR